MAQREWTEQQAMEQWPWMGPGAIIEYDGWTEGDPAVTATVDVVKFSRSPYSPDRYFMGLGVIATDGPRGGYMLNPADLDRRRVRLITAATEDAARQLHPVVPQDTDLLRRLGLTP